jgi:hypothetical protein
MPTQTGGCGCAWGGGRRKTHKGHRGGRRRKTHKQRGGGIIEDSVLALGALGLYQYFVKPTRK